MRSAGLLDADARLLGDGVGRDATDQIGANAKMSVIRLLGQLVLTGSLSRQIQDNAPMSTNIKGNSCSLAKASLLKHLHPKIRGLVRVASDDDDCSWPERDGDESSRRGKVPVERLREFILVLPLGTLCVAQILASIPWLLLDCAQR